MGFGSSASGDPPRPRYAYSLGVPSVHTEECPPSARQTPGLHPELPAQDGEGLAHAGSSLAPRGPLAGAAMSARSERSARARGGNTATNSAVVLTGRNQLLRNPASASLIRRRLVHRLNEVIAELLRHVTQDIIEDLVVVEDLECLHEFMLRILVQDLLHNHLQELVE